MLKINTHTHEIPGPLGDWRTTAVRRNSDLRLLTADEARERVATMLGTNDKPIMAQVKDIDGIVCCYAHRNGDRI
jgi:hypothetical protein